MHNNTKQKQRHQQRHQHPHQHNNTTPTTVDATNNDSPQLLHHSPPPPLRAAHLKQTRNCQQANTCDVVSPLVKDKQQLLLLLFYFASEAESTACPIACIPLSTYSVTPVTALAIGDSRNRALDPTSSE
eukprot:GHVS01052714.1.p2 GENE.GHVS01052714.1~~GHVS01052714.1.p2  ORF type:complete len:129 (-),score=33.54 GHVS01052714.1:895-1281(-)